MAGKIISGTEVAEVIHTEIKKEVADLKSRGITPGLAVVLVGEDSASKVYVAMKEKTANSLSITSKQLSFPEDTDSKELEGVIAGLNSDPEIHGILIQLPLPRHIDEKVVLSCIDPQADRVGHDEERGKREDRPNRQARDANQGSDTRVAVDPFATVRHLINPRQTIQGTR